MLAQNKVQRKKGLHVIKENYITDVCAIITSSVHGIFLVVYLFFLLNCVRPITFDRTKSVGELV